MSQPNFDVLLRRAKSWTPEERMIGRGESFKYIGEKYTNLAKVDPWRMADATELKPDDIITPEELAQRLKVSVAWIKEKRRPRCPNPIPAIPIGKQIRFDWNQVVKWLKECAAADAESLQERRTKHLPQRRKPSKNVITFPKDNEESDETTSSKRKHRQA